MFSLKRSKFFLISGLIAFFLLGSVSLGYFGMQMKADGQMSGCPFMGDQSLICTMNPLEHIATWQNMFTTLPVAKNIFVLLFLVLIFFTIRIWKNVRNPLELKLSSIHRQRYRQQLSILHPLEEAYSDGILNSKTF